MDFVTFTKDVGIRSLGAVSGAENVQGLAGEDGVAVDVISCGRRDICLVKGLFQGALGGCFTYCGLGNVVRRHRTYLDDGRGGCRHRRCTAFSSAASCGCGLICSGFFRLHRIDDGHNAALVLGIICRRDSVGVDALCHKAGTDLCLSEAALVKFFAGH